MDEMLAAASAATQAGVAPNEKQHHPSGRGHGRFVADTGLVAALPVAITPGSK